MSRLMSNPHGCGTSEPDDPGDSFVAGFGLEMRDDRRAFASYRLRDPARPAASDEPIASCSAGSASGVG